MKTIEVKAGMRQRIIYRFSNSLKTTYHFTANPLSPEQNLSGTIEVSGSRWIFPKQPLTQNLQPQNTVNKGMWDTFYSVYVMPDCDVNITLTGSNFPTWGIYLAIGAAIFSAALAIFYIAMG